jgi:hypothetical protein
MGKYTGMNIQTVLLYCIQLYFQFVWEYVFINILSRTFSSQRSSENGMMESVGTSVQTFFTL